MKNKKGIELSINFMVTLILAIVIFTFGIVFARNLLSGAEDITRMTEEDLDDKIGELLCPGDEKVCFGIQTKTLKQDELGIFGVNVLNILGYDADFTLNVQPAGVILKGQSSISTPNPPLQQLPSEPRTERIENNMNKVIGIGIKPPKEARPGKYIFDVTVSYSGGVYGKNKIYVDVP